jgi:hypothetical protein
VLSVLVFLIGVLVVGGLLFLAGSLLLGRGETQPPAELDRSPVELPDGRPVVSDDIRALRISVAFRGYRMTEIDWLLDQFAASLDERDAQIAALRARVGDPAPEAPAPARSAPEPSASEFSVPGTGDDVAVPAADEPEARTDA